MFFFEIFEKKKKNERYLAGSFRGCNKHAPPETPNNQKKTKNKKKKKRHRIQNNVKLPQVEQKTGNK